MECVKDRQNRLYRESSLNFVSREVVDNTKYIKGWPASNWIDSEVVLDQINVTNPYDRTTSEISLKFGADYLGGAHSLQTKTLMYLKLLRLAQSILQHNA